MEDLSGGVLSLDHRYEVLEPRRYHGVAQRYRGAQRPFDLEIDLWVMDLAGRLGLPPAAAGAVAARLAHQARLASLLRSPHVLRVLDYGEVDTHAPCLLAESAHGPSLADIIRHQGRLPLDGTVKVIEEVALALDAIHKLDFGHLGVRPEHVWFEQSPSGTYARLGGMGCNLLKHEIGLIDPQADLDGVLVDHLAPESFDTEEVRAWRQALTGTFKPGFDGEWAEQPIVRDDLPRSPAPLDPVAFDIFGLAVMAYRCLTGEHPLVDDPDMTLAEQLRALASGAPVDPVEFGVELPEGVWRVLRRGLARDPGARPSSALDFARALNEAAAIDEDDEEPVAAPVREEPREEVAAEPASGPTLFGDAAPEELEDEVTEAAVPINWSEPTTELGALMEQPTVRYLVAAVVLLAVTNIVTLFLLAGKGDSGVPVVAADNEAQWSQRTDDGTFEALETPPDALRRDQQAAYRVEVPGKGAVVLDWTPGEGGLSVDLDR